MVGAGEAQAGVCGFAEVRLGVKKTTGCRLEYIHKEDKMFKSQKGFTLIELVLIIVIIGILAAVAIPKYIDLQTEARTASCQGATGAIMSSAAILVAQTPRGPKTVSTVITNTIANGVVFTRVAGPPDLIDIDLDENGDGAGDYDCGADIDIVTPGLATNG